MEVKGNWKKEVIILRLKGGSSHESNLEMAKVFADKFKEECGDHFVFFPVNGENFISSQGFKTITLEF